MPIDRDEPLGVRRRLLRGYGPFFMLAALVLGMSIWVPSRVQEAREAAAGSVEVIGGDSQTTGDGLTSSTVAGTDAGAAPGGVSAAARAAGVAPCTDRVEQIPGDPYSPACRTFTGENGGATSEGVTATEIHVAMRRTQDASLEAAIAQIVGSEIVDNREEIERTALALVDYFNAHFQFYGRKLVLDYYDGQGSIANELLGQGRDKAEVDATQVGGSLHAFADLTGLTEPYGDALVRQKVLAFGAPLLSREWFAKRRPYAWSILPDCSTIVEDAAEYVLKRLNHGPAKFAGGDLQGKPRVITALAPDNSWYQECVQASVELLRKNGFEYDVEPISYQLNLGTMSNQAANLIPKLKSLGVTTLLCGCDPIFPVFLSGVANREGYFPEFVSGYEQDFIGQLWDPNFVRNAMGISPLGPNAGQAPYETIGYAAYKSVANDEPARSVDALYYQIYMLAIGVQGAGPNLTPATFEQAMFDYPERLGPAGLWAFGPGDHTPMDDFHEIFWDPDAVSVTNSKKGAWRDPRPGTRYRHGENQMPPGDPVLPR